MNKQLYLILTLFFINFCALYGAQQETTTLVFAGQEQRTYPNNALKQFGMFKSLLEDCPQEEEEEPLDVSCYGIPAQEFDSAVTYVETDNSLKRNLLDSLGQKAFENLIVTAQKLSLLDNNNQHTLLIETGLQWRSDVAKTIINPPTIPFSDIAITKKVLTTITLQVYKASTRNLSPLEFLPPFYSSSDEFLLPQLSIQDFIDNNCCPEINRDNALFLFSISLSSLHGLHAIPNYENLKDLYLSHNQLTELPNHIFDNLTQLQRLDLDRNQLTELPNHIFDKLTQLHTLRLDNNQLTELSSHIFDKLTQLKRLDLDNNQLTKLPPRIFDTLPQLQKLYLYNNQLTDLPSHIFEKLTQLKTLSLFKNPIAQDEKQKEKLEKNLKKISPQVIIRWKSLLK